MNDVELNDILQDCASIKPKELIISDLKWKYLVRAVVRSKNVMIIGPSGCAKTMAARCVAKALSEYVHEKVMSDNELTKLKGDPSVEIVSVEDV